ncbi:hypothetical protein Bca101_035387 [Brassica carinata]
MANASSLHVTEEREEVMFSEKGHTFSKAHFLNPIATSCEAVAELPRQRHSVSSSPTKLLNSLSSRDSVSGFWVAERRYVSWKWCPETNSFVFPWDEATITLEDVMVLLGFSVLGSPVLESVHSSEMRDAVEKLEKSWQEKKAGHDIVREEPWISASWVEVIWSMKLSL